MPETLWGLRSSVPAGTRATCSLQNPHRDEIQQREDAARRFAPSYSEALRTSMDQCICREYWIFFRKTVAIWIFRVPASLPAMAAYKLRNLFIRQTLPGSKSSIPASFFVHHPEQIDRDYNQRRLSDVPQVQEGPA